MSPTPASVFDLSPAEKLQLVKDLWDDLASTSEAVPVYDWQKEELARRRLNLLQDPLSGLSWEEVKRRVGSRSRSSAPPNPNPEP
jgi:putative addiction module component (TIGR02574 family)